VASLSAADIETLRQGGGWGLALPAELNGAPGPTHVLELREALSLTASQVDAVEAIFRDMKAEAIALGVRLIEAESAIDAAFREGALAPGRLRDLVTTAEDARAALRYAHLARHLSVRPLLTESQIARYQALRGYQADACASVPEGHDASSWRRHNDCE
jgi:hypothetical protein